MLRQTVVVIWRILKLGSFGAFYLLVSASGFVKTMPRQVGDTNKWWDWVFDLCFLDFRFLLIYCLLHSGEHYTIYGWYVKIFPQIKQI